MKRIFNLIIITSAFFITPIFAATPTKLPNYFKCTKKGKNLLCQLPKGFAVHDYFEDAPEGVYELVQKQDDDFFQPKIYVNSKSDKIGELWLSYQNVNYPNGPYIGVISQSGMNRKIINIPATLSSASVYWVYENEAYRCKVQDATLCTVVLNQ